MLTFAAACTTFVAASRQSVWMDEVTARYEALLQDSYTSLTASLEDMENANCDFYRACECVAGSNDEAGVAATVDAPWLTEDAGFGGLATNRSHILFKRTDEDACATVVPDEDLAQLCALQALQPEWEQNLHTAGNEQLSWQYFARHTPDSTFFGTYPAVDWSEVSECPGVYDPTQRPWYVSGVSGIKDMVLVVDASSSTDFSSFAPSASPGTTQNELRFQSEKNIARAFLDTLSFGDFVSVVFYSSSVWTYDASNLVRASYDNLAALDAYVDGFEQKGTSSTNMGLAVQTAVELLQNSGSSSGCTKTIVLLTGGVNTITDLDPVVELSKLEGNSLFFSFVISPGNPNPAQLVPTNLACASAGGVVQTFSDMELKPSVPLEVYDAIMASGITSSAARWTEPYEDAMGQGLLTTVSRPFFVHDEDGVASLDGMLSIDLLLSAFTEPNQTEASTEDVLAHLASLQICEAFESNDGVKTTLQDESVCEEAASSEAAEDPEYVTAYPGIVVAHVLLTVFLLPGGAMAASYVRSRQVCTNWILVGVSMVPLVIYLSTFHALLWPELVRFHNWEAAVMTVEAKEENPYTCCETWDYSDMCQNTNSPSCSSLKSQCTAEQDCSDGYYCCRTECYTCNCYTRCTSSSSSYYRRVLEDLVAGTNATLPAYLPDMLASTVDLPVDEQDVDMNMFEPGAHVLVGSGGRVTHLQTERFATRRVLYDSADPDNDICGLLEERLSQDPDENYDTYLYMYGEMCPLPQPLCEEDPDHILCSAAFATGELIAPASALRRQLGCSVSCSTCCYCAQSVSNQRRLNKRGTCYTPTVTFGYAVDGDGDGTSSIIRAELGDTCGLDEAACAADFLDEYPPIGDAPEESFYNPSNPGEISLSIVYTDAGLGVPIAFGIMYALLILTAYVLALWGCCL